jgi:hypothetical protein
MKKVMRRNTHHDRSSKRTVQLGSQISERSRRGSQTEQLTASDVTYEIVQHDDGWAYKVNGVFSEAFPTHAEALAAA